MFCKGTYGLRLCRFQGGKGRALVLQCFKGMIWEHCCEFFSKDGIGLLGALQCLRLTESFLGSIGGGC